MEGTFHDEWPDHDRLAYDHHLVEEGIRIRFTGLLKCTNELCGEVVSFSGTGIPQEEYFDDPQRGYDYKWVTHFFPKFFNPPIDLFPLWQFDLPHEVSKAVIASFKLFWCDLPSCISKLRLTVERILDDKEIPTAPPRGRRHNLHQRIDIFKEQVDDDLGDFLEAIKWLGNEGTHENNAEKHEVMDAFDMIEHVFEHLYRIQRDQARLRAARDQINERNRRN
ncbi:DUF4145 domain-containing protein [Terasakiella sp.]|uniref:DUF4145 domain-containing protein n=1 Tax=Terasakiella sp. TaxID=2034861 RepID=UPI003AA8FD34